MRRAVLALVHGALIPGAGGGKRWTHWILRGANGRVMGSGETHGREADAKRAAVATVRAVVEPLHVAVWGEWKGLRLVWGAGAPPHAGAFVIVASPVIRDLRRKLRAAKRKR